jgi:hypothetical protein
MVRNSGGAGARPMSDCAMISANSRLRFELIGKDRLALALATGTIQSLGINESFKAEAIEWVQEQEADRAKTKQIEDGRYKTIRAWTIIAAVGSAVAAFASVIALFR